MFLVGLTGGIATGKSTVSQMLADLECIIIDADIIARQVVEPGRPALQKIERKFGRDILNVDGSLNRIKLGEIVFTDERKRKVLNSITHPEIYKEVMWQVVKSFIKGKQFVVLDLPLLFETKSLLPYLSYVIVVNSESDIQLERLKTRNNFTEAEAIQRINSQLPLPEKCSQASHIIDNSGSIENTKHQVEVLYRTLCNSKRHWMIRGPLLFSAGLLCVVSWYFISYVNTF